MAGGAGNDTYVVDSLSDQVIEGTGGGTDEIRSTVGLTNATAYVENYTFLGTTAVNFVGNSSSNQITGTAAADTLIGGKGNDYIDGGADAAADSLSGGNNNDTITIRTLDKADGGSGDDVLVLFNNTGFGTVSGGTNNINNLSGTNLGDTLAFSGTLDLTPASQIAKVSNIETISMEDNIGGAGADALTLNASDVINLGTGVFNPKFSGTDNYSSKDAIRVTGDAGDALHLVQTASGGPDHWHQVTTATNVPAGYTLWVHETTAGSSGASEDAYVLVQTTVAVTTS
jgi:Ca2+-binding RTX toxin-like protein